MNFAAVKDKLERLAGLAEGAAQKLAHEVKADLVSFAESIEGRVRSLEDQHSVLRTHVAAVASQVAAGGAAPSVDRPQTVAEREAAAEAPVKPTDAVAGGGTEQGKSA